MRWLGRGNVPMRWALVATLLTWATIPLLWHIDESGVLSLAEAFWLLFVAAGWLLALAGLALPPWHELERARAVFVWSSVLPLVLLALLPLSYAMDPGVDRGSGSSSLGPPAVDPCASSSTALA